MRYKYEGGYRVWILRVGIREVRDVTIYEGSVPVLPDHDHGSTTEVQRDRVQVVHPPNTTPGPTTPAPTLAPQDAEDLSEDNDEENGVLRFPRAR